MGTKGTKTPKGKSKKGGDYQLNIDNLSSYNDHENNLDMSKYGNVMSGGAESEGATFSHSRFFNTDAILDDYLADSGFGVETAYGKSDPLDAGVGMLAPFNVNKASSPLTMTQTGGAKTPKKMVKKPTIMNHIKGVFSKIKNPFGVKSKTDKSKTVKSKTVKSKTVKSKTVKSKTVKPKTVKPKSTKPKSTKPKKKTV